jgi:ComF family protein
MRNFSFSVYDLLIPAQCVLCNRFILNEDNGICENCISQLEGKKCGEFTSNNDCDAIDKTISIFNYDETIRKLVLTYKDKGVKQLGKFFAKSFHTMHEKYCYEAESITFVPMSNSKKIKRGFNQAEDLANKLSRLGSLPVRNLLTHNGLSDEQKQLDKKKRFENVKSLYSGKRNKNNYDSIILIDDVLTTGATVNACARVLKKNGVKKVFSLTIGRVA